MRKTKPLEPNRSVLVLPDLHFPLNDKQTWKSVLAYARSRQWGRVIQLGDLMDFGCISSHNVNNLRAIEGESLFEDYTYANARLDELQAACPGARIDIIEGNHDYRVERLIDAQPQLKGMVEVWKGLNFRDRGIHWVRFWSRGEILSVGKANYGHGRYTTDHHAKRHAQAYGKNFFYGHLHDIQEYSMVLQGDNKTVAAQSFGCLCDYAQGYMLGRPNRWQQAIGVFHFQPNGYFNKYVVSIFNHSFTSPEGDFYGPAKRSR